MSANAYESAAGARAPTRQHGFARRLLRRIWLWLRPPRRVRPTKVGWIFLGILAAMLFAALNSGNNLLYLLLSFAFALVSVSGIFSEFSIRPVRVLVDFPPAVTVGQPFVFLSSFTNASPRRPAYLLSTDPVRLLPKKTLRLVRPRWLGYLPPKKESAEPLHLWQELVPLRRGLLCIEEIYLATRGPFGLFDRRKRVPARAEIAVLPAPYPVPIPPLLGPQGSGALPSPRAGEGFDLRTLRDYAPGESARKIAWRASARAQSLLVRETDREQLREVTIFLEEAPPKLPPTYLDRQAGIARFLAEELLRRGYLVRVDAGSAPSGFSQSEAELEGALLPLASWEGKRSSAPEVADESSLLRISPRGEVTWPEGL